MCVYACPKFTTTERRRRRRARDIVSINCAQGTSIRDGRAGVVEGVVKKRKRKKKK